jgi:hypothetical protein
MLKSKKRSERMGAEVVDLSNDLRNMLAFWNLG